MALGERTRRLRLIRNLTQEDLALRSGAGLMTIRRLEKSGKVSLENALRVAFALRADDAFSRLFELPKYTSLDEALEQPKRAARARASKRKRS